MAGRERRGERVCVSEDRQASGWRCQEHGARRGEEPPGTPGLNSELSPDPSRRNGGRDLEGNGKNVREREGDEEGGGGSGVGRLTGPGPRGPK